MWYHTYYEVAYTNILFLVCLVYVLHDGYYRKGVHAYADIIYTHYNAHNGVVSIRTEYTYLVCITYVRSTCKCILWAVVHIYITDIVSEKTPHRSIYEIHAYWVEVQYIS